MRLLARAGSKDSVSTRFTFSFYDHLSFRFQPCHHQDRLVCVRSQEWRIQRIRFTLDRNHRGHWERTMPVPNTLETIVAQSALFPSALKALNGDLYFLPLTTEVNSEAHVHRHAVVRPGQLELGHTPTDHPLALYEELSRRCVLHFHALTARRNRADQLASPISLQVERAGLALLTAGRTSAAQTASLRSMDRFRERLFLANKVIKQTNAS